MYNPLPTYEEEDPYGDEEISSSSSTSSWREPKNRVYIHRLRLLIIVSVLSTIFVTLLTIQFMISITQLEVFYQADTFYGHVQVQGFDSAYNHLGNSTCSGYRECTEVICRYSTLSPPMVPVNGPRVFTAIDYGDHPPSCSALELTGYFSIDQYRTAFVIAAIGVALYMSVPFLLGLLGYIGVRYQLWTRAFLVVTLGASVTLGLSYCLIVAQSYIREQQDSILVGQLVSLLFLLLETFCVFMIGTLAL